MASKKRPPLRIIGKQTIVLNGKSISYTVKRSNRARYIRLEIKPGSGLTAVMPRFYNADLLPSFLQSKQSWIISKLAKYGGRMSTDSKSKPIITDSIPYLGNNMRIIRQSNNGNIENIRIEHNNLIINSQLDNSMLNKALENWYRMQAEKIIGEKAYLASNKLNLNFNRITIRGQNTLWASCSRKKNLSFNWKLLMMPEPVIDYVVIHELMHLVEMNHSKRFWNLVADNCPDWKKHRKTMKDYSISLSSKLC